MRIDAEEGRGRGLQIGEINGALKDGKGLQQQGEELAETRLGDLTDEQKREIVSFRQDTMRAVLSGEFDPAKAAKNAPEILKKIAEERGLSLEDTFARLHEQFHKSDDTFRKMLVEKMMANIQTEADEEVLAEEISEKAVLETEEEGEQSEAFDQALFDMRLKDIASEVRGV